MSCSRFELWAVSDDPAELQLAAEHADGCDACGEIWRGQRGLQRQVEAWGGPIEAPSRLEADVRDRIGGALRNTARVIPLEARRPRSRSPLLLWGSLAASLVVGAGLAFVGFGSRQSLPQTAERLLVSQALSGVETAEREHARAIQKLEQAAVPVLAEANDPATPPQRAAKLFAFRDRLAFLDTTIDDVRGFIVTNPGNAGARALLLSAFQEKTDVLRQVLALEERS